MHSHLSDHFLSAIAPRRFTPIRRRVARARRLLRIRAPFLYPVLLNSYFWLGLAVLIIAHSIVLPVLHTVIGPAVADVINNTGAVADAAGGAGYPIFSFAIVGWLFFLLGLTAFFVVDAGIRLVLSRPLPASMGGRRLIWRWVRFSLFTWALATTHRRETVKWVLAESQREVVVFAKKELGFMWAGPRTTPIPKAGAIEDALPDSAEASQTAAVVPSKPKATPVGKKASKR